MTGTVVVSLDFELGWGHRRTRPEYVRKLREDPDATIDRIRELIDLFEEYEIPATWAVVGELVTEGDDPLFHNPDLFEYLLDSDVDHEIGLHSHSHRDFDSLSEAEAREDLEAGVSALAEWGIEPESFVFPRNRIGHVELLREYGFRYYRTDSQDSKFDKLKALISPQGTSLSIKDETPLDVSGTMFLAAHHPEQFVRWKVKWDLKRAALSGGLVHYWLHPHNVATDPHLLSMLEDVFQWCNGDDSSDSITNERICTAPSQESN